MTLFNINKHGAGRRKWIVDHEGKTHYRTKKIYYMIGENNIQLVDVFDEDDSGHMIYQFRMPMSREEYESYRTRGIPIPQERLGENANCSCGSPANLCTDGKAPKEWQNRIVCRSLLQFGVHQTSMIIEDNQMKLPTKIANDKLMLDSDIVKILKNSEDK